jgi:hypothetical protein
MWTAEYRHILSIIKANLRLLIAICLVFILERLATFYKELKLEEFNVICNAKTIATKLAATTLKKHELLNHICSGNNISLSDYVAKIGKETVAAIKSIKNISEENGEKITTKKFVIIGVFWHESLIFEFLNKLREFSPGFLKILKIDINKFAVITAVKPTLKVEITCITYQRR